MKGHENYPHVSVFGGGGFIGRHFCEKSQFSNTAIPRENLEAVSETLVYFIGTTDNYNIFENPYLDIESNLVELIKRLEASRKKFNSLKIIFISSWFVYGEGNLPYREDQPCRPKGFYSITKLAAEMLLESYCKTYNLDFIILRLGNVIGGKDNKASKKKNAIQHMVQNLRKNESINLYENGKIVRDIIHVDDVVQGIDLILRKGENREIYNLASGKSIEIKTLIENYKAYIGSVSDVNSVETPKFHSIVQVKDAWIDVTKIRKLGFEVTKEINNELLDQL